MKRLHTLVMIFMLTMTQCFAQVIHLQGKWKFHIGDDQSWASAAFDDSRWGSIKVPSTWEDEGFNGYDGFAWYRISFDGTQLDKNELYYLNLGFIDDADAAYLNGQYIGFSGQFPPKFKTAYNSERKYVLPNQIINFTGKNTIAVRVFDAVHGGGIIDGPIGIYDMNDNGGLLLDLRGIWSFAKYNKGEMPPRDNEWVNMMVPGAWEHQGFYKYDGLAWYKKTFDVPQKFTDAPLVLILGKIDDFDEVYLNGQLIGSTNDHRRYGLSQSYNVVRVYDIPKQLLKKGSTNTIQVLVEDMGNIGGIYDGIIGITTKSNYQKLLEEK